MRLNMIECVFRALAKLLRTAATLCERVAGKAPVPDAKARMKHLLSLDRLSKEQARELDELTSGFPGPVIFLDDPRESL